MLDGAGMPSIQPTAPLGLGDHHQCCCTGPATPVMPAPGVRWTCVRTHSHAERWAQANLVRSGYATFLPMHTVTRPDRVVPTLRHRVQMPLFSSYLFVAHDPATSWGPIRDAPGVRDVVRVGNRIAYARPGTVENLAEALRMAVDGAEASAASGAPDRRRAPCGAIVEVARGIFSGHQGVVVLAEEDMALVSVLFLGELRQIAMDWDSLSRRN